MATRTGEVVAMDSGEAMLARVRERVGAAGHETVSFEEGTDADLQDRQGPFRVTTMSRSFHWMDRRVTPERLRAITESGGGVAILTDREPLTKGNHTGGRDRGWPRTGPSGTPDRRRRTSPGDDSGHLRTGASIGRPWHDAASCSRRATSRT
jgi:hypothetical protein